MQEFKEGLQESYCVVKVERASYIKARSEATAYVITFNKEHLPFSIYIPSEKQDTIVQPFENKPIICNMCQSYDHTAKRCNGEMVCKLRAEKGHNKQECLKSGEEYKCVHCAGNNMTGSRACGKQIRETELSQIQMQRKVPFRRALQIKAVEQQEQRHTGESFAQMFDCKMSENDKRKFSPWMLQKCL